MTEAIKALIAEAEAHRVDPHSGWLCCDWCSERRDQWCRECNEMWPCLIRRLAGALSGAEPGPWESAHV